MKPIKQSPKKYTDKKHLCPVCGKPRSGSSIYIDHGKCAEQAAKKSKEKSITVKILDREFAVSQEDRRIGKARIKAKKYIKGDLPDWMFS